MSFEDEWARHQANAARRETSMRLAGHDPDTLGPDGHPTLKVTPAILRGKAGTADTVRTDLGKADNESLTETGQIRSGLAGFACADAFEAFQERWNAQMRHLRGLLETKVAASLRAAASGFEASDTLPVDGGGGKPKS